MNHMIKRNVLFCIIAIFLLTLIDAKLVNGGVVLLDKVRIGLFYGNKSVSDFSIYSKGDIKIDMYDGSKYANLVNMPTGTYLIRKDYDYILNGNHYGQYHISYGETFASYEEANVCANLYKAKGIDAYPSYGNNWTVCSGFFEAEQQAWEYIGSKVVPELGEGAYGVKKPSINRIFVFNGDKVKFAFENETSFVSFSPKDGQNILKVNGTGYRGDIEVRRMTGSDMTVINVLPLEEYIYGVVPKEIGTKAHIEALKAQAVAARSYAIANVGKHSNYKFDLCSTECQVYGGYDAEAEQTNKAVDQTKGKKLTYGGNIASTYYFTSSGGRTENVENVWQNEIPYLRSVEDKYETGTSSHYNWEVTLTKEQLKEKLLSKNINVGDVKTLKVKALTQAGRVLELDIVGKDGVNSLNKEKCRTSFDLYSQLYSISTDADVYLGNYKTQLTGKKIITATGTKEIADSSNVKIVNEDRTVKQVQTTPSKYTFTGKGWGHAIGMSQDGAIGMADNGFTYDQILMHYFTGTKIE